MECNVINKTILFIKEKDENNDLQVDKSYQRDFVWSKYQKQYLIDSILKEIDIPKIYLHRKIDTDKVNWIVDGQQRIFTILEFLKNKFKTSKDLDEDIGSKYFRDLTADQRTRFQSFPINIVIVTDATDDQIKDMFTRHQYGSSLKAPEIRRNWTGVMPEQVTKLSEHKLFKDEDIKNILNYKNTHYSYEHTVTMLLHLLYHDNFAMLTQPQFKKTYKANEAITSDAPIIKQANTVYNFILKYFKLLQPKFGVAVFRTISFMVYKFQQQYAMKNFEDKFAHAYMDFENERKIFNNKLLGANDRAEEEIDEDGQDKHFLEYNTYARGDSIANQSGLYGVLQTAILEKIKDIPTKDKSRSFTGCQKEILWQLSEFRCQAKKTEDWFDKNACLAKADGTIERTQKHTDHIKPHVVGGPSRISNGQILCSACNLRKSDKIT